MKAYLFIETGEVREPQTGEWGIDDDGWIVPWNDDSADEKETILTRHEIEINPLADILTVSQGNKGVPLCIEWKEIPIPRPKKKVKKCQYITINHDSLGIKRGEVTGWLTEKEAKKRGLEPEDRIYQTEIEAEE
ncbi:MAG: hypothetical protein ABFD82_23510 [Syntrophaceae bacterium]